MTRRRSLSDEERELWSGVARSIKPMHRTRKLSAAPAASDKIAHSSESTATPRAATRQAAAPSAAPKKNALPLAPLGRKLKKRVASGREPIEARLDLHGFTQRQAHAELLRFLRRAQSDDIRIVLVVTGKGTGRGQGRGTDRHDGADERGILKRQVPNWLSQPEFRSLVVGFEDAHFGHGGQGALYVRLRRARQ
jgi:DNA-nicking Smr family endonuclease